MFGRNIRLAPTSLQRDKIKVITSCRTLIMKRKKKDLSSSFKHEECCYNDKTFMKETQRGEERPARGAQNCARRKETTTTQTKRLQVPKMQNAPWVSWCSFDDSSSRIQSEKKKKERERNLNTKWRRVFWCITFNIFVLFQWFIYFGAFQRPTCRRSVWQVTSRPPFCQTAFFVFDEWRHKSCFWQ